MQKFLTIMVSFFLMLPLISSIATEKKQNTKDNNSSNDQSTLSAGQLLGITAVAAGAIGAGGGYQIGKRVEEKSGYNEAQNAYEDQKKVAVAVRQSKVRALQNEIDDIVEKEKKDSPHLSRALDTYGKHAKNIVSAETKAQFGDKLREMQMQAHSFETIPPRVNGQMQSIIERSMKV